MVWCYTFTRQHLNHNSFPSYKTLVKLSFKSTSRASTLNSNRSLKKRARKKRSENCLPLPRSAICSPSPPPRPAKRRTESPTGHNFLHIFSSLKYHSTWPSFRRSIIPSKPKTTTSPIGRSPIDQIYPHKDSRPSERPFTPATLTAHTCSASDRRITWLGQNPRDSLDPWKRFGHSLSPNFRARSFRAGKGSRSACSQASFQLPPRSGSPGRQGQCETSLPRHYRFRVFPTTC